MSEWGWNPATFEALGTVAASFIATIGLLVSLAVLRRERIDERRAQANMVAIADVTSQAGDRQEPLTWRHVDGDRWEEVPGEHYKVQVVSFRLANGSDLPISYSELLVRVEDSAQWKHYAKRRLGDVAVVTDEDPLSTFTDPSAEKGYLSGRHRGWPDVMLAKDSWNLSFEAAVFDRYLANTDFGVVFIDRLGKVWTIRGDSVLLEGRRLTTEEVVRA